MTKASSDETHVTIVFYCTYTKIVPLKHELVVKMLPSTCSRSLTIERASLRSTYRPFSIDSGRPLPSRDQSGAALYQRGRSVMCPFPSFATTNETHSAWSWPASNAFPIYQRRESERADGGWRAKGGGSGKRMDGAYASDLWLSLTACCLPPSFDRRRPLRSASQFRDRVPSGIC